MKTQREGINKYIGRKIYELRIAKGMSREAISSCMGVSHQQLKKYEVGTNRIPIDRLLILADKFDVGVDYFLPPMVALKPPPDHKLSLFNGNLFSSVKSTKVKTAIMTLLSEVKKLEDSVEYLSSK